MSDTGFKTGVQDNQAAEHRTNATSDKTVDEVCRRIESMQSGGEIHFPPNYSPQNALKSSWLQLQKLRDKNDKPVLEVCTRASIVNALIDMVIQGLSAAKKQVHFIPYGRELTAMRSYHGTVAVTKRLKGVLNVAARVVHEGDDFIYEIDDANVTIIKHVQKLENIDNPITGAYCTISFDDGRSSFSEIMTMKQIEVSWSKTKMRTNSVQTDFADEMAMRTVINRACKRFVNTSDDSDLLIGAFNNTEYTPVDSGETQLDANTVIIDAEDVTANPQLTALEHSPLDIAQAPKTISEFDPGF